jgi:hypothetical protein
MLAFPYPYLPPMLWPTQSRQSRSLVRYKRAARVALSAPLLAALAVPLFVTDTGSGAVVVRVVDASGTVEVGMSGTAVTSVVT